MAQSIGGGGGAVLTGGAATTTTLSADNAGDGGAAPLDLAGDILTTGDGATAILLQSLGGGGGLIDGASTGSADGAGAGGAVNLSGMPDRLEVQRARLRHYTVDRDLAGRVHDVGDIVAQVIILGRREDDRVSGLGGGAPGQACQDEAYEQGDNSHSKCDTRGWMKRSPS